MKTIRRSLSCGGRNWCSKVTSPESPTDRCKIPSYHHRYVQLWYPNSGETTSSSPEEYYWNLSLIRKWFSLPVLLARLVLIVWISRTKPPWRQGDLNIKSTGLIIRRARKRVGKTKTSVVSRCFLQLKLREVTPAPFILMPCVPNDQTILWNWHQLQLFIGQ